MGTQKLQKKTKSRFVLCPAGCGKHIPENGVNLHLDKCMAEQQQEEETQQQQRVAVTQDMTPAKATVESASDSHATETPVDNVKEKANESSPDEKLSTCEKEEANTADDVMKATEKQDTTHITAAEEIEAQKQVTPEQVTIPKNEMAGGPSVFAKMMEQSKRIFSKENKQPLKQTFCLLRESGEMLLTFQGRSLQPDLDQVKWSSTVQIRDRSRLAANDALTRREIELTLGSLVPSHSTSTTSTRLVEKHSRLSAPVLKSILQKCIRRRRPLPAVRVAMELLDKSTGDLLRRLPVIVLEDSALHPDVPFLVWLMVAYSKDYLLPRPLMLRILQIVYEVASCQWSDPLVMIEPSEQQKVQEESGLSLSSFNQEPGLASKSAEETVWSMLIRAEYGGMKCDVRMLQQYAVMWKDRFASGRAPVTVTSNFPSSTQTAATAAPTVDVEWSKVPVLMHQKAKEQSAARVTTLCETGIDQLRIEDVCVEGVDFHCSAVIEHLLSDQELTGMCHDLLVLSQGVDAARVPATMEGRRSWLEGIFKSCMWTFSAGVNRRRPLMGGTSFLDDTHPYANIWNELLEPRVRQYQERYVKDRLAR
jgi:hypothetical protein